MSISEPEVPPLSLWKHQGPLASITMAAIAARIAEKHGLTVDDLKTGGRRRRVCWPRQEAMHEMMETGKWSLPRVGMFFGGMDHTTVLWACRSHERRSARGPH